MGWTVTLGFLAAVVLAMLPVADPMLLLGCAKILVCNVVLAARLR
jgi:hypothetical protein